MYISLCSNSTTNVIFQRRKRSRGSPDELAITLAITLIGSFLVMWNQRLPSKVTLLKTLIYWHCQYMHVYDILLLSFWNGFNLFPIYHVRKSTLHEVTSDNSLSQYYMVIHRALVCFLSSSLKYIPVWLVNVLATHFLPPPISGSHRKVVRSPFLALHGNDD